MFMLMRRNPHLVLDFQRMRQAFDRLHQAWRGNSPYDVLPEIVKNIHGFANSRYKTRVTGALLNSYQNSGRAPSRGINKAALITAVNGDEVMTLGRKH